MLTIRLQRVGRKHEPTFRIVLTDSKNGPKSGKYLEVLGSYDPRDKNVTQVDGEAVKAWIAKGAQTSDTVNNILINQGVIEGKKVNVLPKKSPIIDEEALAAEAEAKAAAEAEAAQAEEATEEAPAEDAVEETPTEETTEEVVEEAPAEEEKTEEVAEEAPAEEEKVEETPVEEAPAEETSEEVKEESAE